MELTLTNFCFCFFFFFIYSWPVCNKEEFQLCQKTQHAVLLCVRLWWNECGQGKEWWRGVGVGWGDPFGHSRISRMVWCSIGSLAMTIMAAVLLNVFRVHCLWVENHRMASCEQHYTVGLTVWSRRLPPCLLHSLCKACLYRDALYKIWKCIYLEMC